MSDIFRITGGSPEGESYPFHHDEGLEDLPQEVAAQLLYERVMQAETVENFSNRDGKTVDLVRDEAGLAVRRTYHYEALRILVPRTEDDDFVTRYLKFNKMFDTAELKVVPSFMVDAREPVIVTKYFGRLDEENHSNTVKGQPIDKKVALCSGLGSLLSSDEEYLPNYQAFDSKDAFLAHPETGELHLTDCDPYLVSRDTSNLVSRRMTEIMFSRYIEKITENMRDWANDKEELKAMAFAFVESSKEIIFGEEEWYKYADILDSFSRVHSISMGMNPRLPGVILDN